MTREIHGGFSIIAMKNEKLRMNSGGILKFIYDYIFSHFRLSRTLKNCPPTSSRCARDASPCWLWAYRRTVWYGGYFCYALFLIPEDDSWKSSWSWAGLLPSLERSYLSDLLCRFSSARIFPGRGDAEITKDRFTPSMTSETLNPWSGEFVWPTWALTFSGGVNCPRAPYGWSEKSCRVLYVGWWTSGRADVGGRHVGT